MNSTAFLSNSRWGRYRPTRLTDSLTSSCCSMRTEWVKPTPSPRVPVAPRPLFLSGRFIKKKRVFFGKNKNNEASPSPDMISRCPPYYGAESVPYPYFPLLRTHLYRNTRSKKKIKKRGGKEKRGGESVGLRFPSHETLNTKEVSELRPLITYWLQCTVLFALCYSFVLLTQCPSQKPGTCPYPQPGDASCAVTVTDVRVLLL